MHEKLVTPPLLQKLPNDAASLPQSEKWTRQPAGHVLHIIYTGKYYCTWGLHFSGFSLVQCLRDHAILHTRLSPVSGAKVNFAMNACNRELGTRLHIYTKDLNLIILSETRVQYVGYEYMLLYLEWSSASLCMYTCMSLHCNLQC